MSRPPESVALYARVSKAEDQTTQNQMIALRQWAHASGYRVEGEYEEAISSRDTRPQKEALLKKLRIGSLNAVAFVSLSRWGRSLVELASEMREAQELGWTMISLKEGLRFDSAAGKMFAGILAVFAEFERDLNRERTLAGLARARAQGKRLGRPPKDQTRKALLARLRYLEKQRGPVLPPRPPTGG